MDKEFEALRNLERVSKNSEIIIQRVIGVYMGGGVQVVPHKTNIYNEYKNDFETIKQTLTTKSKKEKAFDIIKENFDIEVIVIDDYCYIEITSKICKMSKTQRAIKINPENKDKVEALKEVL
jgi:hypothetical protein